MEPFTILEKEEKKPFHLFDNVVECESAKSADHDLQYITALRKEYPDKIITAVPQVSANIINYAHGGNAEIQLDTSTDSYASWKGYVVPNIRSHEGGLGEATQFAKYMMKWKDESFVVFLVQIGFSAAQYVIADKHDGENVLGSSKVTDELIMAVGAWQVDDNEVIWIFDQYWRQDHNLYKQVKKASWDKVILDEAQKKDLSSVSNTFFSSKSIYEELGVPWKRGLLFHGPPGNGKTVSTKALMHELLFERKDDPIPTLYVKNAPYPYHIGVVFQQARQLAPCMLVLEDIETIVTSNTRSYFFNELDGLESNDGLFVVATTNYLERLDPGLTKRPSRFDRKYLFPLPNEHERLLYCQYWQKKIEPNKNVDFPQKLCPPMAAVTPGFSFAFMQECFVATMLKLAEEDDEVWPRDQFDDFDKYEVWRTFRAQAKILRKEIEDTPEGVLAETSAPSSSAVGPSPSSKRFSRQATIRGFNKSTGKQVELVPNERRPLPLAFRDRKQPEVNTFVYEWVAPRQ